MSYAQFHARATLFMLLLILTAGASQGAELLDDGSFSNAASGSQTSNSAWGLSANAPDGVASSAQFQAGFANAGGLSEGGNGVWIKSFEGNQSKGDPPANATLSQTVTAPVNGSVTLTFVAGREENFTADEFYVSLSSSGTGGTVSIDLLTAAIPPGNIGGSASANEGGTPFELTLDGVSNGDQLTVEAVMVNGVDSDIPGGQSAFLDEFSLVPTFSIGILAEDSDEAFFISSLSPSNHGTFEVPELAGINSTYDDETHLFGVTSFAATVVDSNDEQLRVFVRVDAVDSKFTPEPWVAAGASSPNEPFFQTWRLDVGALLGGSAPISVPGFHVFAIEGLVYDGSEPITPTSLNVVDLSTSVGMAGSLVVGNDGSDIGGSNVTGLEIAWYVTSEIFSDGFESGDALEWDSASP